MEFLKKMRKKLTPLPGKNDIKKIAEQELRENIDMVESLRKYDAGEKDISTRNIERRLRDIRTTS